MGEPDEVGGHAFISYAREDSRNVDQLQQQLEAAGVRVWRDTRRLWPGDEWRVKIRRAITEDALVFIACFSRKSLARRISYQNEELFLAVEQLRLRPPGEPWFIPVRFDECNIPDHDIGGGRSLRDLNWADVFGDSSGEATRRLVTAVMRILGQSSAISVRPAGPESDAAIPAKSRMGAVEDLVVEVLHHWDDESPPYWLVGSGLRIGDAYVLTAAHNVGRGELLVRSRDGEWPATVRLRGREEHADLALLEITGDRIERPPWRFGAVDQQTAGFLDRCWAIGFPRYKEREYGERGAPPRQRLTTHIRGQMPVGENLRYSLLTLQVDSAPAAFGGVGQSDWSGMSGAPVFADDIVVGVISGHLRQEGMSSLSVTPISAIDLLPDSWEWWRLLGTGPANLVRLHAPPWRDDALYVWTAADSQAGLEVIADHGDIESIEPGQPVDLIALRRGRVPNLQRDFARLGSVFDDWLASGRSRQEGSERLRVLWLVGDPGTERSKALLACLSRAGTQGRAVYDASRDLELAASTLRQSVLTPGFALPPLISVDLKEDQTADPWGTAKTAITSAARQFPAEQGINLREEDPYPRMIVAGTIEQEIAAVGLLYGLIDIKPIDLRGHDQQHLNSLPGATEIGAQAFSGTHVYNRGLPITAQTLFGRKREIATFWRDWESDQIQVLSVVGYGGTGKSALVNAWLQEMRERDYSGAQKVLAWSFDSQRTEENLVSADLFVSTALSWLGDESPPSLNLWARGLRLASLIKQHRFLLVLDGLDRLQYPLTAAQGGGQLTDDSIRALLEELARPDWQGLCLITTRVPLTDLSRFKNDQARPGRGSAEQMNLENLNERDGADLLQHLIRRKADFRELQAAVREVEGHTLAITLLGNYLRDVHGGDLSGRFDLERLTVDVREGGHARRIMASYEEWLERNERFAELTILRLIGLFDRPGAPEAMAALLADPLMRAFTGQLERVGSDAWDSAVSVLREMGLLNRETPNMPGTLDAEPLIREHFRDQLRKDRPDLWLQGNRVLFDYYRRQAPPLPSSSAGMSTLYAAVTHGCAAEFHQQVFDEILLRRVWRDRRTNYSTRRLGMIGSDLVALSNYFSPGQWTKFQTSSLTPRSRVLLLTNAGVRLRQLGRLVDARDCFGAVVREIDLQAAQAEELEDASYAAAQSCELLVIAGKLIGSSHESDGALFSGERAVEYADRGDDPYFSMHARSCLAEVHFMLNDLVQADSMFRQAIDIERERHPRPPFLYSQSLFRYGYFLIETGRAVSILDDAAQDPLWGTNGADTSLLSEAIRLLILGAAHRALIESGNRDPAFLTATETILDNAITASQTAGHADYRVRALLERAHFYQARHETRYYPRILDDLDKAVAEAQRGQMDLLYADALLRQVACYLNVWPVMTNPERSLIREKINDGLGKAARLVTTIGYGRRLMTLAGLWKAAGEAGALADAR